MIMGEKYRDHSAVDTNMLDRKDLPAIVVVGKIGSGKSTALNNLFKLNLEARSSPSSVTKTLNERIVVYNEVNTRVVDTPGFGGITLTTDMIMKEITKAVKGTDFTLLYCLPVKPSDILTETDRAIIKALHQYFGRNVWDKCVLLLTFSDVAPEAEFASNYQSDGYRDYLRGHIQAFHHILKECGSRISEIRGTFDYSILEQHSLQNNTGTILAVPVMKDKGSSGIISDWTSQAHAVISETSLTKRISRKTYPNSLQDFLFQMWHNPSRSVTVAMQLAKKNLGIVIFGTIMGASAGGLIGWMYEETFGMFIGSFIGTFMGILLSLLISMAIKEQ